MTKKDYVLIAAAITAARRVQINMTDPAAVADGISRILAESLQSDNSRFDRAKFLAACGAQS